MDLKLKCRLKLKRISTKMMQKEASKKKESHSQSSVTNNPSLECKMPELSVYMDYRQYLLDYYNYKKSLSKRLLRPYNYAVFSAAADIKSPNYLKTIIEGKRNLSDDMIIRFAKALNFNKDMTEEFRFLVQFTQATDPAERNVFLKGLCELRFEQKLKSGEIDRKTWEKIPNWVAWIIYAMVDQDGVEFSNDGIKKLLRGKASDDEIQTALNSLIKFGELARDEKSGEIKKSHSLIESPEDVPVALVRKLQTQLMYLGLESLFQDSPNEREFGTLTMCLTKAEFEEIRFKLRQMRKNLHKDNSISRMSKKGERVYQLNIQLFPVTNISTPNKTFLGKNFHLAQQNFIEGNSACSGNSAVAFQNGLAIDNIETLGSGTGVSANSEIHGNDPQSKTKATVNNLVQEAHDALKQLS